MTGASTGSSSPPSMEAMARYIEAFPTIAESSNHLKAKKFGIPIVPQSSKPKSKVSKEKFPFEKVDSSAVKIKSIPIRFQWPGDGGHEPIPGKGESELLTMAGEGIGKPSHAIAKGPTS